MTRIGDSPYVQREVELLPVRLQGSTYVPGVVEGIVRDRPSDVLEKHPATFAVDDDLLFARHFSNGRCQSPWARRSDQSPAASGTSEYERAAASKFSS